MDWRRTATTPRSMGRLVWKGKRIPKRTKWSKSTWRDQEHLEDQEVEDHQEVRLQRDLPFRRMRMMMALSHHLEEDRPFDQEEPVLDIHHPMAEAEEDHHHHHHHMLHQALEEECPRVLLPSIDIEKAFRSSRCNGM